MSDAEVAATVVRRIEETLSDRLGATGPDPAAKLASVAGRLPEEVAIKLDYLIGTHRRLNCEAGFALDDSATFDRVAAEVLAELELLPAVPVLPNPATPDPPPASAGFRTLPRLRAERPAGRKGPPPPPPPICGLRGWPMALLVAAVLATMAASIWL